jgi:hypothetical protein
MWIYSQTTGLMTHNGVESGVGYSGHGDGLNNPAMQDVEGVGPCPQGIYSIEQAIMHPKLGKVAMRLELKENKIGVHHSWHSRALSRVPLRWPGVSWWRDPKLPSKRYVLATITGRDDLLAIRCMRSPCESISGLMPYSRSMEYAHEVPRPRTALLSQLDKNGSKSLALGARAEESEVPDGVSVVE